MKIFFILNPTRRGRQWEYREQAAQAAKRYGWTPRFGEVDRANPHSVDHLIRQASEEDCTRVAVLGGDGTLHRVVNALQRQKRLKQIEIAILPAGTCNDFARFIGLRRRHLDEALRRAFAGKAVETDLGMSDAELFTNNAGIGRQPVPAGRTIKPFQTLKNFRPIPLKAMWEKGSIEGVFYMVLACNGPFFSGGLHFSRKPSLNDGLLDIYLVPALPKWRLVTPLVFGRLGKPVRLRRLITLQVQRIEIQAATDLWPQADGEPPGKAVRRVVFSMSPEKAMIVR
jgi:diacylglycerol kinase (ATP)